MPIAKPSQMFPLQILKMSELREQSPTIWSFAGIPCLKWIGMHLAFDIKSSIDVKSRIPNGLNFMSRIRWLCVFNFK